YVVDSDPDEDPDEDPKEDHTDYPADGGDRDDEPSDDDDNDTDDEDEEPFEDEDDDKGDDELQPTLLLYLLSPQTKVAFAQTRLHRARKTVRLEPPMSASIEARIAEHAVAPKPPLPIASPPLPLPSPLTTNPTDVGAPLGYRAAEIRMRAALPPLLLPSTSHRTDIPEADMPPRKRDFLTTPAPRLKIGESSAAGAARQPGTTLEANLRRDRVMETGYGITDTWMRLLRPCWRDRPYHCHTAMILDREEMYARIAWTSFEDKSAAIEAHVRTLEA
ncbi:hypothetical protein Tco_1519042, partial [Tanacetum coccineum]